MIFNILFMSGLDPWQRVLLIIVLVSALVFALTMHEFAHASVALLNGDRTAKMNGRVSLNPLRHMDPIGFLMLLVAGFGFAKPVPVNPHNFKKRRWGLFTVSVAGVLTNLVLAIISTGIYVSLHVYANLSPYSFLMLFLSYFQYINLMLCFFNLLPFFPLDGFNVLSSIFRRNNKAVDFLRKYGMYILITLVGLSFIVGRFDPTGATILKYFDILGLYFKYTAEKVLNGLIWVWGKIFGL